MAPERAPKRAGTVRGCKGDGKVGVQQGLSYRVQFSTKNACDDSDDMTYDIDDLYHGRDEHARTIITVGMGIAITMSKMHCNNICI